MHRKLSKERTWTEAEVRRAIEFIKTEQPETWAQLECLGVDASDFDEPTDEQEAIVRRVAGLLRRLHLDCEFGEIAGLFSSIRTMIHRTRAR